MVKEVICTVCPQGCRITVTGEKNNIEKIEGHNCQRGYTYAETEFSNPCRILTSSVPVSGAMRAMLPIRSSAPVPKDLLLDCMAEIRKHSVSVPVAMHQVIIPNILGTGIDMIASMPLE